MFKNYLKVTLRNIYRRKLYAAINIAGLAVGLACAILIMIWVGQERSYDRFHGNADRLYRVAMTNDDRDFHGYYMPGLLADYLKENIAEISDATNVRYLSDSKLAVDNKGIFCTGAFVHESFFDMFTFPFVAGDATSAFASGIVVTENLARCLFGTTDVMGKTVRYADAVDLTISGVLADIPERSHIQMDFFVSFMNAPGWMKTWDNKILYTYVLLHENTSYAAVSEKIWNVYNDHNPGAYPNYYYLQPLSDTHLHNLEAGNLGQSTLITYVYIFSALAIIVLIMACINFMNLSTATAISRAREVGLRKVVGARRGQLAGQFLCESVVFSLISLVVAVMLVELLLPVVNNFLELRLTMRLSLDFVLLLVGIAIVTGLLSGSYPALLLSSLYPISVFKGRGAPLFRIGREGRASSGRSLVMNLRRLLVITQFAVSVFFVIVVIGLYTQFDYIRNKDMGYTRDSVVILPLQGALAANSAAVKSELLKNPEITGVTRALSDHINWGESCGIDWEGKDPNNTFDVGINRVDYDYASTLGLDVLQGRFFSQEYPSDANGAVVLNEAAVRAMGIDDPVGKRISIPALRRTGTIVGVVRDFHNQSMRREISPFAFVFGDYYQKMFIRVESDDIRRTMNFIKDKIRAFAPDDPIAYTFLDQEIDNLYRTEAMTAKLATAITIIAVFISCLGLFGMVSYLAGRRVREIGIRKVFGASVRSVVSLLSKELLILVAVSNIIAWPAAYYVLHKWLEGFAYRSAIGWSIYVLAAAAVLILAQMTIMYRAIRAAHTNPIDTLRCE